HRALLVLHSFPTRRSSDLITGLVLLAGHMLRIDRTIPGSWWGEAGHSALVLLPAAFFEELFIRGYLFSVLRRFAGWRMALIFTRDRKSTRLNSSHRTISYA